MHYITCIIVLICSTNLATAGMMDGIPGLGEMKSMADGMMKTFMGPNNPLKSQAEEILKMAQGGGANYMAEIQKKMAEMTQMASQMTGAGAQQAQAVAKQAMEGFEKLMGENAPAKKMQEYMQTIVQQMSG